jgi:hypothetical protein
VCRLPTLAIDFLLEAFFIGIDVDVHKLLQPLTKFPGLRAQLKIHRDNLFRGQDGRPESGKYPLGGRAGKSWWKLYVWFDASSWFP